MTVSDLLEQPCNKSDNAIKLVTMKYYEVTSYTRKNLTTRQQDVFATDLLQACQQVVTMLLFYQVATRLSLTTC
jgi:hypothetical protein